MAAGRVSTVTFVAVSATVAQDLFYIKPAADKVCIIHYASCFAAGGTADAGDAQEELLRVEIIRLPATVTVGSGGSAPTPGMVNVNDTAVSYTARVNDTTVATTSGTAVTLIAESMNNRVGWVHFPAPEDRIPIANAAALVVRLNTAPADAILLSGTCVVEELP